MSQDLVFGPMAAMALLTFAVLGLIPIRRLRAAFAGRVKAEDFRFGESPAVPGDVSIPSGTAEPAGLRRSAVAGLMQRGRATDPAALTLAWTYVALQLIRSMIT